MWYYGRMNMKFPVGPGQSKVKGPEVLSSKVNLVAKKITQLAEDKKTDISTENGARDFVSSSKRFLMDISVDEVVAELKNLGIIKITPPEKQQKVQIKKEVPHISIELPKLAGLTTIENENLKRQFEENEKHNNELNKIFKDEKELNAILEISLSLRKENSIESDEYYDAFADAGLIKGGREEVKEDLDGPKGLKARKEEFKQKALLQEEGKRKSSENNKKVATIIERGIAYGVSELEWYGKGINMEPASEFDDVKRGVDDVVEIVKNEDESTFMGLGIDVTYRGLLSQEYKDKVFKLLQFIRNGQKTKIKYHKNHAGKMMKEFAVPKIILSFNINDVKDMANLIKNIHDPKVKEEFKNSQQKFDVMNQLIIQCELLSLFAEESQNDIFRQYTDIVSSVKELSWKNPEIKNILDERHEDEVSKNMRYLIQEFKDIEKQKEFLLKETEEID